MFTFTGYKCPFCGKPFAEGDDIVVCPECGAPYHRDCYNKSGHCVFEAKHGPNFEWTPTEEDQASANAARTVTCPKCGTKCPGNSKFCLECGAPLSPEAAREYAAGQGNAQSASDVYRSAFGSATLDDIPIRDWEAYIGRSSPLYLAVFARMQQTGHRISLNLSAFIFGPIYFLYRKMWKPAAIFTALFFLVNLPYLLLMLSVTGSPIAAAFNPDNLFFLVGLCGWLNMIIMVFRGLYAHYLYRKDAGARIRSLTADLPAGADKEELLRTSGGTSMKAVILFCLSVFLIDLIMTRLMGPDLSALLTLMGLA